MQAEHEEGTELRTCTWCCLSLKSHTNARWTDIIQENPRFICPLLLRPRNCIAWANFAELLGAERSTDGDEELLPILEVGRQANDP